MANVCRFNILQLPTIIFLIFIGRSLGQGTFGKVRLGTHLITGEKVAIKILEKDKIKDQSDVERVTREIHILKIVRHPNVIQLYEVSILSLILTILFVSLDYWDFPPAFPHNGVREWRWAIRLHRQEKTPIRRWGMPILPANNFRCWVHP